MIYVFYIARNKYGGENRAKLGAKPTKIRKLLMDAAYDRSENRQYL